MNPRAVVAIIALLLIASFAAADHYYQRGGDYWYHSSDPYQAYTRQLVVESGYTSCGRYYPGRSYYYYYPVQAKLPTAADPDWRIKLLDLATARDKAEAKIRAGAFEQKYFVEAVQALGLTGNFKLENYGAAPPYGPSYGVHGANYSLYGSGTHTNSLQLGYHGANGSTLYGVSSLANLYGDANLSQLYQQANRLAENAQGLAGQATTEFGQLVGQEGDNRARVAEILAKGQAVQEYLRALQGASTKTETKTFTFQTKPNMPPADNLPPPGPEKQAGQVQQGGQLRAAWEASATKSCLSCHSGKKIEGGFDVTQYPAMSVEQKIKVIGRLVHPDASKRMPKDGPKLTQEEIQLWLVN